MEWSVGFMSCTTVSSNSCRAGRSNLLSAVCPANDLIRFGKEVRRLAENPFQLQLNHFPFQFSPVNHENHVCRYVTSILFLK